jgi:hypothetical protein
MSGYFITYSGHESTGTEYETRAEAWAELYSTMNDEFKAARAHGWKHAVFEHNQKRGFCEVRAGDDKRCPLWLNGKLHAC